MRRFLGVAFTGFAATVHYLYLSRVPFLGFVALLALPIFAVGSGRAIVLGAYDLKNEWASFLVGITCGLVAGSIFFAARLIMSLCAKRFRLTISDQMQRRLAWMWGAALVGAVMLNILTILRASKPDPGSTAAIAGALLGGLSLALAGAYLVGTISDKAGDNLLYRAAVWLGIKVGLQRQSGYLRLRTANSPNAARTPNDWEYEDGQARAVSYTLLVLAAYVVTTAYAIPPLAVLMLLLSLVVLMLTAITFFWDRYRLPLFVIVVLYLWLMGFHNKSDHYYALWSSPKVDPELSPAEVVGRAANEHIPVVAVAAAGGGIQSAAWTTSVLYQLGQRLAADGYDLPKSVRLISGVSGGSVGGMFYGESFNEAPRNYEHGFTAACASGLGPALRGLLRQDLMRVIAPFFVTDICDDRGRALEHAWCNHFDNAFKPDRKLRDATLSEWGRDALALARPALVFNATIVESGERLAISTVPKRQTLVGETEFTDRYHADIAISTAARLSATFPFVSPTDRPAIADPVTRTCVASPAAELKRAIFPYGGDQYHVVDGGYYENSGLVGAIEWVDEALTHLTNKATNPNNYPVPQNVLIIEVDGFERPYDTEDASASELQEGLPAVGGSGVPHGEIYDLTSPLMTIVNVRGSGQRSFARRLLRMFQRRWQLQNVNVVDVRVFFEVDNPENREEGVNTAQVAKAMVGKKPAGWFYIGVDPGKEPLSWHLRPIEVAELAKSWAGFYDSSRPDSYKTIQDFFQAANTRP